MKWFSSQTKSLSFSPKGNELKSHLKVLSLNILRFCTSFFWITLKKVIQPIRRFSDIRSNITIRRKTLQKNPSDFNASDSISAFWEALPLFSIVGIFKRPLSLYEARLLPSVPSYAVFQLIHQLRSRADYWTLWTAQKSVLELIWFSAAPNFRYQFPPAHHSQDKINILNEKSTMIWWSVRKIDWLPNYIFPLGSIKMFLLLYSSFFSKSGLIFRHYQFTVDSMMAYGLKTCFWPILKYRNFRLLFYSVIVAEKVQ